MRTFAKKSKARQLKSGMFVATPVSRIPGLTQASSLLSHLDSRNTVLPKLRSPGNKHETRPGRAIPAGLTHDFSRIPVLGKPTGMSGKAEKTYRVNTISGVSGFETSVAPPGGATDEELTTNGSGSGTPAAPPAASFCQCTPTSADIKNVVKYTNGKLYGHEFDFVVKLNYTKLGGSATKHQDCTLEWWEKSTRPPAWQTVIKKNTWHDMFALYPTSPTFDGWTKNRTKPCPGKETATIHDPPAASVDLPARTLWFDLKVKGGGTTKSATGTQVLEPDGKGGIKTQTFTVP